MSACDDHAPVPTSPWTDDAFLGAARLFRALGDPARLRTLELLASGEQCVSALAASSGEGLSTVSQRLKLLRAEGLVTPRRDGRHIFYALADEHVSALITNALHHATEARS